MLKWLIRRRIAAFERDYGYDSSYANEILDVGIRPMLVFNRIMPMSRCAMPGSQPRSRRC
jgi:hypothetical protein